LIKHRDADDQLKPNKAAVCGRKVGD